MGAEEDDALMARVAERDESAFGCLVRRHIDPLHRYLARLTGSPDDADELTQETFLRVWQRAASYRPGKVRLTTWLHRIAHNLAVDGARRQRPDPVADPPERADDAADPARSVAGFELGRRLDAAMAALPDSQRSAVLLCQVQGFANHEAASIMGVSVRALESLLARARRSLRLAIDDPAQPLSRPLESEQRRP